MASSIRISGAVAGRLWWPVGHPAIRHASADVARSHLSPGCCTPAADAFPDLRTALVEMLCDGDLASTGFLPGTLEITVRKVTKTPGGADRVRLRTWRVRGRCWATDDVFADERLAEECA